MFAPWLLLGCLFVGPMAAGVVVLAVTENQSQVLIPKAEELWASTSMESTLDPIESKLSIKWSDGDDVLSPNWTGIVSQIADFSSVVSTGDRVVKIDGLWRLGVHTDSPFYRILTKSDTGSDVAMLNNVLMRLGYRYNSGQFWGNGTSAGMGQLLTDLGVPPANGQPIRFDPEIFIWLPADETTVSGISARVGAPAPAAGSPLLLGPKKPASVTLEAIGGRELSRPKDQGQWVLTTNSSSVLYTGDPAAPFADPALIGTLSGGAPESLNVVLQRQVPQEAWSIPVSSVFSGPSGRFCVLVRDNVNPNSEEIVEVAVVAGGLGATKVTGDLKTNVEILADPTSTRADLKCE